MKNGQDNGKEFDQSLGDIVTILVIHFMEKMDLKEYVLTLDDVKHVKSKQMHFKIDANKLTVKLT